MAGEFLTKEQESSKDIEGLRYLEDLLKQGQSLKEIILNRKEAGELQAVLLGVKPCTTITSDEELVFRTIPAISERFIIGKEVISNPLLVDKVVKAYPQYFKDDPSDVQSIIDKYFPKGPISKFHEQVGLLLGYPEQAVKDWITLHKYPKPLAALIDKIDADSTDVATAQELIDEWAKNINTTYGGTGEIHSYPQDPIFLHKVETLLRKYFQEEPDRVELYLDIIKNHRVVNVDGLITYSRLGPLTSEDEGIYKTYHTVFEQTNLADFVKNERIKFKLEKELLREQVRRHKLEALQRGDYTELVNANVKGDLTPANIQLLHELLIKLQGKYGSQDVFLDYLSDELGQNNEPIVTVRQLVDYLSTIFTV